ncbi:MAG: glycosyltransferase family 2 protein [Eggerthellaceae bacterium]|jgi:glycosyltransferase involved in cell wall biosynthesis|nr:glycosyltransferase family 2 protein [Eggerthellaceae bacterium]
MKTLVIIPAFNEEGSIVETVGSLREAMPGVDYVVIDDGSSDRTGELCAENHLDAISLFANIGLAGGFQTGMKYAWRKGYDAALQFDADGQHRPDYIQAMLDAMGETGADIVVGSRFLARRKQLSGRMAGSALISGLIRLTTGKSVKDPTSGMRLYNRSMIELFAAGHDMAPEPETLAYCLRKGAKVVEVPVEMRERTAGKSYLSASKAASYMLRTCISILVLQWFR